MQSFIFQSSTSSFPIPIWVKYDTKASGLRRDWIKAPLSLKRSHSIKDRGHNSWEWSAFISLLVFWLQVKCQAAAGFQTWKFSRLSALREMVCPFWGGMIWFDLNCTSWKIHFNISIWMYKYLTISIIWVDVDEMEIHFSRYFIFYSILETKLLPLISPEILATEWLKRFSWWLSLILWRVDTEGRLKWKES